MFLQIKEKKTISEDEFLIQLTINTQESKVFEIPFTSPHTPSTAKKLDWYFEEYIKEPYAASTKINRTEKLIKDYGEYLFNQLFQQENIANLYRAGLQQEGFRGIKVEIVSKKDSLLFQSILWETLRDPLDANEPLIVKGIQIYRKTETIPSLKATFGDYPQINLLIVTARPNEEYDVGHRTIQRPLMDIIESLGKMKVNPYILRPGTYRALKNHLREKGRNFYHIIHFDMHGEVATYNELLDARENKKVSFSYSFGKATFQGRYGLDELPPYEGRRALLFFESEDEPCAKPVTAAEIANLVKDNRIPICILNACQSALQERGTSETNLAKVMHEQGVRLVLAMRYTISVTAAKIMMKELYNKLIDNNSLADAISWGQKELHDDKERNSELGLTIDMQDWMLPVVYQQEAIDRIPLRSFTPEEEITLLEKRSKQPNFPPERYGFEGRDLDILKIEKLLQTKNHLLLKGMKQVGKSALLRYLTKWWTSTKFRNVQLVLYFNWQKQPLTFEVFVDALIDNLFDEPTIKWIKNQKLSIKALRVIDVLNQRPSAIILDNLFQFSDSEIIRFLSQLKEGGKSFVVYGSVNTEEALQSYTFLDNIYQLEGLDKDAAFQLAREIIETTTPKKMKALTEKEDDKYDLENLLKLLNGFPAAMELILPLLNDYSIQELLKKYSDGTLPIRV